MVRVTDVSNSRITEANNAGQTGRLNIASDRFTALVAKKLQIVSMADVMRILEIRAVIAETPEAGRLKAVEEAITELNAMANVK